MPASRSRPEHRAAHRSQDHDRAMPSAPTGGVPDDMAQLQHTLGNQALGRLLSTPPNDGGGAPPPIQIARASRPLIQRLRSGNAGGVQFNEGPRDVVSIRLPALSGDLDSLLAGIDAVMANFGSAGRTYVQTLDFIPDFRSRLAEEGHPAATGGGVRMGRDRWMTIRVRIVRGEGRRIEGLRLLSAIEVAEAPEGMRIEGEPAEREETPPEAQAPAPPPRAEPAPEPASEEEPAPGGWRGALSSLASGAEALGNLSSGRWVWEPVTGQLAEWEAELDRIGEQEGAAEGVSLGEVLSVPVGLLFSILSSLVGMLDLLARLNPAALTLHGAATAARGITGEYTAADLRRDAEQVGDQALSLITLGLREAVAHVREGWREGNAFRMSQAVGEIAMAVMALVGAVRGVRAASSTGRMAAAVEAEAAAGTGAAEAAAGARPTTPSELGQRPTRPGSGAPERPTVPERGLAERPTEPGPGAAERPTVPERGLAERPTEPGRGAGERSTVPAERPTVSERGPTEPGPGPAERPTVPDQRATVSERGPTEPGRGAGERSTVPAERPTVSERGPTEPGPGAAERPTVPAERPGEPAGRPAAAVRGLQRIDDIAEARRLQAEYAAEGRAHVNHIDRAELQRHWEASGGRGNAPPAWIDETGHAAFDTNRVGHPPETAGPARGGAPEAAQRPTVSERGPTEPGPAATEQRATVSERGPTEPGPAAAEQRATVSERGPTEPGPAAAVEQRATVSERGPTEPGPAAAAEQRATVSERGPTEPGPAAVEQRATVSERGPTEPGPAAVEQRATVSERGPTEPGAAAERPGRTVRPEMRVDPEGIIRDQARAQARLEQAYREGPFPHEAMNAEVYAAEWRAYGGTGEPPFAYRHANGRWTFDRTRLAEPSPEARAAWRARAMSEMEGRPQQRVTPWEEQAPAGEQGPAGAEPGPAPAEGPAGARGAAAERPSSGRGQPTAERPVRPEMRVDQSSAITDAAEAQRALEQAYLDGPFPREVMSAEVHAAEWRAYGGTGEPPYAYRHQNGQWTFDRSRLAEPSPEAQAAWNDRALRDIRAAQEARAAAEQARIAANTPRWVRSMDEPAQVRAEIEARLGAGEGNRVNIILNPDRYLAWWRNARGPETVALAFEDANGVLRVNGQRMAGH